MYVDKNAFDSKKFKMTLTAIIATMLMPVLVPRLGMAAGVVVDPVASYTADAVIAFVAGVYVYVQTQIDKQLITNSTDKGAAPGASNGTGNPV